MPWFTCLGLCIGMSYIYFKWLIFLIYYNYNTFGPLIRYWTMRYVLRNNYWYYYPQYYRFEAKHQYFKKLSQWTNNFINITKTLATQHQLFSIYCNQAKFSPVEVGAGMLAHVWMHYYFLLFMEKLDLEALMTYRDKMPLVQYTRNNNDNN